MEWVKGTKKERKRENLTKIEKERQEREMVGRQGK